MTGVAITAWGTALPEKVVTNNDLAAYLDTSDEWISERTGIRERRIGSTTGELAIEAGRAALDRAGLTGADIDLIILATSTPDSAMPPTSSVVQRALGIRGGAMDMNVACSGFVYGLSVAHNMVLGGMQRVLLIGSDTMSKITDQTDRATAVLFGDGAGAVIVEATDGDDRLLASDLLADGSLASILRCDLGSTIEMNGREVYKHAVLLVTQSVKDVCKRAGITPADIDAFVAHQANVRILDAITGRLDMKEGITPVVLDRTGNTSAASVPLALAEIANQGKLHDGDHVVFCGFGAGMTVATQLWKWGK